MNRTKFNDGDESLEAVMNTICNSNKSRISSKVEKMYPLNNFSQDNYDLETSASNLIEEIIGQSSISNMNRTFYEIFNQRRNSEFNKQLKDKAKTMILNRFNEFGLETKIQKFTVENEMGKFIGENLIGILSGSFRNVKGKDNIVVLGAHYDTVRESPGIDDNGSGSVAMLETARIISSMKKLNHTVIFVSFDLEEYGLLGSSAFVKEYIIPHELIQRKANFLGAYIIDMLLNYETKVNSQSIPNDLRRVSDDVFIFTVKE